MTKRRVKSAKGKLVDFDLIAIKEQIASGPAPTNVQARQDHIDARMRRRLRSKKRSIGVDKSAPVEVNKDLPSAERPNEPEPLIDEPTPKKSTTKQKARKD